MDRVLFSLRQYSRFCLFVKFEVILKSQNSSHSTRYLSHFCLRERCRCRNLDGPSEHLLAVQKCSRCLRAQYCSPDCQHAHWMAHKAAYNKRRGAPLSRVLPREDDDMPALMYIVSLLGHS
jgi:hypothetical protein